MMRAMTWFEVEPKYAPLLRALGLNSFQSVLEHFSSPQQPSPRRLSRGSAIVTRGQLVHGTESLDVYFKEYRHRENAWRFLFRHSKARREFENYGVLRSLELPVAERIAAGEERDGFG